MNSIREFLEYDEHYTCIYDEYGYELHGYYITSNGRVFSEKKLSRDEDPFLQLTINDNNVYFKSGNKNYNIERLVATYFVKNPNNYKFINHIDGDKKNNRMDNLEWVENKVYSKRTLSTYSILEEKEIILEEGELIHKIEGIDQNLSITSHGRIYNHDTQEFKNLDALCPLAAGLSLYVTINNKHSSMLIHRIVAKYFLKGFKDNMIVQHIDGKKRNNNVNNLKLKSKYELMQYLDQRKLPYIKTVRWRI